MIADDGTTSSLFAGRYRFETIDEDWDIGRSGFTLPAFDIVNKRMVVIKRADVTSPHAEQHEHSLQNEAKALRALKGLGVPELYEESKADYGSRHFTYLVMEYIDGMRVEKDYDLLDSVERAQILTELFRLLAEAHRRGIVNGDIDFKHLFWYRKKKQLVVIDWGNATVGVDPQKNSLFAYDLARSAEIIYSLVTLKGNPPAAGSLALPDASEIFPDMFPLPNEFYTLCEWAPRNPSDDINPPFSSSELYIAAKKWLARFAPEYGLKDSESKTLSSSQAHQQPPRRTKRKAGVMGALVIAACAVLVVATIASWPFIFSWTPTPIPTDLSAATTTILPDENTVTPKSPDTITPPTEMPGADGTPSPTASLASVEPQTKTETPTPTLPPSGAYSPILIFDSNLSIDTQKTCWVNETSPLLNLTVQPTEGFDRRDDFNWQFRMAKTRATTDSIQTNFSDCVSGQQIAALSLNVWMERIGLQSEFGIFVESESGQRRDYTLWTDTSNNTLHIKVRDNGSVSSDNVQYLVSPKMEGFFPSEYYQYSIIIFLEINQQGQDVLYLDKGPGKRMNVSEIDPEQMKTNPPITLPSLGLVKSIGLVGYGPDCQAILWPLAFYSYSK